MINKWQTFFPNCIYWCSMNKYCWLKQVDFVFISKMYICKYLCALVSSCILQGSSYMSVWGFSSLLCVRYPAVLILKILTLLEKEVAKQLSTPPGHCVSSLCINYFFCSLFGNIFWQNLYGYTVYCIFTVQILKSLTSQDIKYFEHTFF